MTDATTEFFDGLARRGHELLLLGDHLVVDPALPADIGHLELLDIPGRWGRIDAFGRGRVRLESRQRPRPRARKRA